MAPELRDEDVEACSAQLRSMLAPYCSCGSPPGGQAGAATHTLGEAAARITRKKGRPAPKTRGDNGEGHRPNYPMMCPRPSNDDFDRDERLDLDALLTGPDVRPVSLEATWDAHAGEVPEHLRPRLEVERWYDVDSVYMEASSLAALRGGAYLCLLPPFTSTVTQNSHRRLRGGLEPHKKKNIRLFRAGPVTVELVFPNHGVNAQAGQTNMLSDEDQRALVDDHLLPAIRGAVPGVVYQHLPQSFQAAVAAATTSQAKMQATEESAPNRQRTMLSHPIQAQYLGPIWDRLRASLNRVGQGPFSDPRLLIQGHDLKNITNAASAEAALEGLRQEVFRYIDFGHVLWERCWVDFGIRDVPIVPNDVRFCPLTLLYRKPCLHSMAKDPGGAWVGFQPREYCQYLLRDAASLELVRDGAGGSPVRQVKAYNSHKMVFFTPDKQHTPFGHERFSSLCLSNALHEELRHARTDKRSGRHAEGAPALQAWENQQRSVFHQLGASGATSYGVRREVVANLFALLRAVAGGGLADHLAPGRRPLGRTPEGTHHPFTAVPTSDLALFILASCTRYVVAINRLASRTWPAGQGTQAPEPPAVPTQLRMMRTNLVLARLLCYSCSSVQTSRQPFLFRDRWAAREPGGDQEPEERAGLGLEQVLQRRGMVHLEPAQLDATLPALTPEVDRLVDWPRGFGIRARDLAGDQKLSSLAVVAFNDLVRTHVREAYRHVADGMRGDGGFGNAALAGATRAFSTELETVVSGFNRYLLRSLADMVARGFGLSPKAVREQVLAPLGLKPTHRSSFRVLSLSSIDRVHVLAYRLAGERQLRRLFAPDRPGAPADSLGLPMPRVALVRKKGLTWSEHVAGCLSGLRASAAEAGPGWRGTGFVQQYWAADARWRSFASRHGLQPELHDMWQRYVSVYSGRLVLVTPNFDSSKFIAVQSSAARPATAPPVVYAKWCIPGAPRDAVGAEPPGHSVTNLMVRARFASALATPGAMPQWLSGYVDAGLNVVPGHEGKPARPFETAHLRRCHRDGTREPTSAFRAAMGPMAFRSRWGKSCDAHLMLNSAVTPHLESYPAGNLLHGPGQLPRAALYREVLQVYGQGADVPYTCMWLFAPFQLLDRPGLDDPQMVPVLLGLGWFDCPRQAAGNRHHEFFRGFRDGHHGIEPRLQLLPELLELHVRAQQDVEDAIDEEDDELFPAPEDL